MKKVLIVGIILGITTLFIGCGSKTKVTEAYNEYIGQAKVEILNGDYDKALQYITLAKDENTGDKVVDELSEQIDMYRKLEKWIWTAEDGNLTEDLYKSIEGQLEEANKFIKRKFESNLMIENIKIKIEELSFAVDNAKEIQEVEGKIQEKLDFSSNVSLEMYDDLDNKRFEEAYNKSFELETSLEELYSLDLLDSSEDYYERNYPLYALITNSRKVYNGINKLNSEKENNPKLYDNLSNEAKAYSEKYNYGECFLEFLMDSRDGNGYSYYAILKDEDGNYALGGKAIGETESAFWVMDESSNLIDLLDSVYDYSTVSNEEVEWDPSWSAKPDGYYDGINNN